VTAVTPVNAGQMAVLAPAQAETAFAHTFATRARTFGFAGRFLPRSRRRAATALYAFCRAIDDLADELPPEVGVPALQGWEAWLREVEADRRPAPPAADADGALSEAVLWITEEYGVPVRYLRHLVEGAIQDAARAEIADFPELREFCYRMAGTVGLAMAYVLGIRSADALRCAERLGIAMQLTNVLRDVGEDLGRGRVYLPRVERERFGVSRAHLDRRTADEQFASLMRFQIARARSYYAAGMPGVFLLPAECRLGILVAGRLYAAILSQIERQRYDVFSRRAATSTMQKAFTAAQAYVSLRGGPWLAPAEARQSPSGAAQQELALP
jgi:15-cis-phytoene synthase